MTSAELNERVAVAGEFVRACDKEDGFRDRSIVTIVAALEAGLCNPETGAAFEALYMLRDLLKQQEGN